MRLLCFFGSGISFKSNMPCVRQITHAILTEYWNRGSNILYHRQSNETKLRRGDLQTRAFLHLLADSATEYLVKRGAGELDYEILFDLAMRVEGESMRDSHDPAMDAYLRELVQGAQGRGLFSAVEVGPNYDANIMLRVGHWASESQILIQSAVKELLGLPVQPKGFDALVALCNSSRFSGTDIVTLNHDLLLECLFKQNNIKFEDGFCDVDGDVIYFDPRKIKAAVCVRILKPHGSINWYRVARNVPHGWLPAYGIPLEGADPNRLQSGNGTLLPPSGPDPVFITGVRKARMYLSEIYGAQVNLMREMLSDTSCVLCCGYGWRDEGMNRILYEWMCDSINNRVVLLHPNPEDELFSKQGSFWNAISERMIKTHLRIHREYLCDTTVESLFSTF